MPYDLTNNPYLPGDPYSYDLKWIVSQVQHAIELYEPLHDEFTSLSEEYDRLYEYVRDYFDNLDVSQEVSAKLDEMAQDGTLLAVVTPYLNGIDADIQAHIDQQDLVLDNFGDDIAAQNTQIATLINRMDTFTSLEEGSTTGDAELIDARNGSFGKTYSTAGDAIRDCDNELLAMIKSISDSGYQALSPGNHWAIGAYTTPMTGNYTTTKRARYISTWIPRVPDHDFVALLMGETNYTARVAIYDAQNLTSLNTILVGSAGTDYGGGMIIIPHEYTNKFIGIELAYRGDLNHDFDSAEIDTLPDIIKFFYADVKSDIEDADAAIADIIARINNDERDMIFNYTIDKEQYGIEFASDAFIAESTGQYQSNLSYPYLFGEKAWVLAEPEYPIAFTLNDSTYNFRAFLYSDSGMSYFIDKTEIFPGDHTFICTGDYNGISYHYVRFNIWAADQDYSSATYEAACSAFEIRQTSPVYPMPDRYPIPEIRFTVDVPLSWRENSASDAVTI